MQSCCDGFLFTLLSFKNKKDVWCLVFVVCLWWLMLWLVIWFSLLSFVIYQLLMCSPCKVILMNFNTFLLCIVSLVCILGEFRHFLAMCTLLIVHFWSTLLVFYMHCLIVVSSITCFLCVASLLCINENFQHFLFMYLFNRLWCSLSLPCCVLLVFCWTLSCSFSNLYLPLNFFYVEAWKKVFLQLLLQLPTQTLSNLWTYKMLEEYFICFSFKKIFCKFFLKIIFWGKKKL